MPTKRKSTKAVPKKRPAAKKIYVVEDDPIILEYLVSVLKDFRFKVASSLTASDALLRIADENSDLILMDIMLPDMDGITLCRQIHDDFRTCHIPIVMLTALSDSSTIRNAYQHGAVDFIPKPFNRELLRSKIKRALTGEVHA